LADGIHLEARLEHEAQCILVIIGATPERGKELVGFTDGIRESSQSWDDLLLNLKRRGLITAPQIAVAKPALAKAGGALGFWKALGEVWPTTREQRCWVHKTANILNKMPKSLHTKAKRALQEMAETKKDAVTAFDTFVETHQVKYDRAADCLTKDRDALLAFYDSLPSIGSTYGRRTPLKAPLRPFDTAPSGQRAACRTRPPSPWFQACRGCAEKLAPDRRP
jgi:putative transposase